MRKPFRFAQEELEVDKVYQQQQAGQSDSDFDELYQGIRQDVTAKREQTEAESEDSASVNSDDVTDDQNTETDEADPSPELDDKEPDAKETMESFLEEHRLAITEHIAQEDIFTKDNLIIAGKTVGSAAIDGMVWLKNIGFEYGPVLLKHVYKGVLYALDKTLRGIFKGSVEITKYIRKRMNSYTVFKEKIQKAREALNLIEDGDKQEPTFFTDEVVIQQLLIGNSTDFKKNTEVSLNFFKTYLGSFSGKVNDHVTGIGRIVDNVIKTNGQYVAHYQPIVTLFPGFKKGMIQGYHPESEEIDAYVYEHLLPGNICFLGFLPKKNLATRDNIVTALSESKLFLGVNVTAVKAERSIPFKTKTELLAYLDVLESICNVGLNSERTYIEVVQKRNGLKGYLKKYTKFLFDLREKMSIHESMADLISLELQYLDKTYINGSLQIQDYTVRVLNASLEYVKENIKTLS